MTENVEYKQMLNGGGKSAPRKRIVWVDWFKALCISLMVLCHSGQKGLPMELLSAFFMSGLFMVSGYLYHPRKAARLWSAFLLPIIIYSFVEFSFDSLLLIFHGEDINVAGRLARMWQPLFITNDGTYDTPMTGVWFLIVLMMIRLLAGDLKFMNGILEKYHLHIILLCAAVLTLLGLEGTQAVGKYHVGKLLYCLPYFLTGCVVRRYERVLTSLPKSLLPVMLVAYVMFTLAQGIVIDYNGIFNAGFMVAYVNFVVASLLLINIFNSYCKRSSVIELVSTGTLLILGLHSPLIRICGHLPVPFAKSLVVAMLVVAICAVIIKLVKRFKLNFLLGK